jgi:hypothetical protein
MIGAKTKNVPSAYTTSVRECPVIPDAAGRVVAYVNFTETSFETPGSSMVTP